MPSNKWGEWNVYMEAYQAGLIDKVEALKKTEIFDKAGVLERTDMVAQLQQQLEGATKKIKELEGDIQTREREVYHARQRAEIEKFKATLDSTSARAKAAGTVFEKRLNDATGQIRQAIREEPVEEFKETDSPQGPMGNQE